MATGAISSADLIIEAITRHPGCCLDDLVRFCPELTWNQIFYEVDLLSRRGLLKLTLGGPGQYSLVVCAEQAPHALQPQAAPAHPPVSTRPRQDAQCERCGGLMVAEDHDDRSGWRCILCGERMDLVAMTQRRSPVSHRLRMVETHH